MRAIETVLYVTVDPKNLLGGDKEKPVPALTTLLLGVCDNNPKKFDEACRLVSLFIEKAEEVVLASVAKDRQYTAAIDWVCSRGLTSVSLGESKIGLEEAKLKAIVKARDNGWSPPKLWRWVSRSENHVELEEVAVTGRVP